MQTINDRTIILYNTQRLAITIMNNEAKLMSNYFKFYVVDMRNYEIIFELS